MIRESFPSKSNPNQPPYVAQVDESTGLVSCNCRGWINKRVGKPRFCDHCKKLVAMHGLTVEERDGQMFVVAPVNDADRIRNLQETERAANIAKPLSPGHTVGSGFWDSAEKRAEKSAFLQPMLAFAEGKSPDSYSATDWTLEEKFDGHRIVMAVSASKVVAWSRTEKSRTLPTHILAQASKLPDGTYDGELIVPGKHSYDVTAGMNSGTETLVLFDLLAALGQSTTSEPQSLRRAMLEVAFGALDVRQKAIVLTTQQAPSQKAVDAIWKRGGEGAIIKRLSARYQPGFRSADWIKVKKVAAATLVIVGFEPGKVGPYSAVQIRDAEGIETTVKTLDNATMRAIEKNPGSFIGRSLVISYQERTPSGKYRHPMWDHLLDSTSATTKGRKS